MSDTPRLVDLRKVCPLCGGSGSVEASQSEDGRFSYQDQCPDCSSFGVVPVEPAEILSAVLSLEGVETMTVASMLEARGFQPGRYAIIPIHAEET